MSEVNNPKQKWLREVGCWLSQGLNLFICIKGSTADETVSSRVGKYKEDNLGRVPFKLSWPIPFYYIVYHTLSRIPYLKGHFIRAIESDEGENK